MSRSSSTQNMDFSIPRRKFHVFDTQTFQVTVCQSHSGINYFIMERSENSVRSLRRSIIRGSVSKLMTTRTRHKRAFTAVKKNHFTAIWWKCKTISLNLTLSQASADETLTSIFLVLFPDVSGFRVEYIFPNKFQVKAPAWLVWFAFFDSSHLS